MAETIHLTPELDSLNAAISILELCLRVTAGKMGFTIAYNALIHLRLRRNAELKAYLEGAAQ